VAHVSHRLSNAFQGALAGGGDPATSPLYVFGPFLSLIVVAGVASVTFGASVWLVVLTVVTVSLMYRKVMTWVTDGSGGSGLSEEEFGAWAVKVNAGITFVEYTLTFLVSMAALVTLLSDRIPFLNDRFLGTQYRTALAILLSVLTGWLVNRGPKTAARAFGPATFAVLLLLWGMVVATVCRLGFVLPDLQLRAFVPPYLHFTLKGFSRMLALMTGVEVFANLVAAFEGKPHEKSRRAFESLAIIMGTTVVTMLIVGPAIYRLSNPQNLRVSVFTQTMDHLFPWPLAYLGTLVGILVLASACAASAQGLQNLALGLRYRHYIPAVLGQRNRFDVADKPVWLEVGIVVGCYAVFGTSEETYLAIYAIGVFVLLSMTSCAALKRLLHEIRHRISATEVLNLLGVSFAALLTTVATVIVFLERFREGAWTYLIFLPALYTVFTAFRAKLGEPLPLAEHLGRLYSGQYLLAYRRKKQPEAENPFQDIVVPLDGSTIAEQALPITEALCRKFQSRLTLISVEPNGGSGKGLNEKIAVQTVSTSSRSQIEAYLTEMAAKLRMNGIGVDSFFARGRPEIIVPAVARDVGADLLVLTTHGRSELERLFLSDTSTRIVRRSPSPVLLVRPGGYPGTTYTQFRRLLVCLDGSENAEQVLRYARAIAARCTSEMLLLSVPEGDFEESALRKYLDGVAEALRRRGLHPRPIVCGSGPARTIVEVSESEDTDLIVLARQGRGGLDRAVEIGSVADRVMQIAERPVLLVFVSPSTP
jgi:nucleotide-binding universal stress UspA family protein